MTQSTYDIIARLKRHDKIGNTVAQQGQKDDMDAFKDSVTKLQSELETLQTSLPSVSNLLGNVAADFKRVTDASDGLQSGLGVATGIMKDLATEINSTVKQMTFFEEANKGLNKSMGMSSKGAATYSQTLRGLAKDLKIGDDKLFKYAAGLNKLTGGILINNNADKDRQKLLLQGQTYLQTNIGLTEEAALNYELYAQSIGKNAIEASAELYDFAKAFEVSTGIDATQTQTQILQDISSMGEDLQAQYGRIPGNLEKATMKARLLGTTMENLNKTGNAMLNIESSVGAEMEYQALTGRRLLTNSGKSLTNEYRMATLKGNGVKQAELMAQFLEKEGKGLATNLLARKKAAELFGVSEAELMRQQRVLDLTKSLGAAEIIKSAKGDMDKVAKQLAKDGKSETDIAQLLKDSDTRTTAERSEDHLKHIRQDMIKDSGLGAGDVTGTRDKIENDVTGLFKGAKNLQATIGTATFQKSVGKFADAGAAFNIAVQPAGSLAAIIPKFGAVVTAAITKAKLLFTGIPKADLEEATVKVATGGYISGNGTGTSDSIPARLSDGEYVINAAATKKYRSTLDKINKNPATFANGGPVSNNQGMETILRSILFQMQSSNNILGSTQMNGRKKI